MGNLPKLPALRTRRLSEITNPLKSKTPKKSLKELFWSLYKRKRQSKKREVRKNVEFNEKYFPLFKNLGLLFDNLLNESGDSYEISKKKRNREKDRTDEERGIVCSCAVRTDSKPGESKSNKKTIISAKTLTLPSEKSFTATTTTNPSLGDVSSLRPNKDIPLLLSRDPSSSRGNNHGYSERSSPAFHRSIERDFTRNLRNRKHYTGDGEYKFSTECDEEDTDTTSRNDASRAESRGGRVRESPDIPYDRNAAHEETESTKIKKASDNNFRRQIHEFPRKNKFKTRRNATESAEFIPKHIRRIRGPLSENKISDFTGPLQSEEDYEEGIYSVTLNNTSDKRLTDGSGTPSGENQEIRPRDETVVSINDLSNVNLALQSGPQINAPSVSIIDGYSVARGKNGQNKLNEKTIHIHVK